MKQQTVVSQCFVLKDECFKNSTSKDVPPESLIVHVHVRSRVTNIHFQPLLEVDLGRKVVRPWPECTALLMVIIGRVRERGTPSAQPARGVQ